MSDQKGPQRTQADARATASSMGLECFFPSAYEVFLDLDVGKDSSKPVLNTQVLRILGETVGVIDHLTTVSKSGKAKHMYVRVCEPLSEPERIAWQVCLGSDPVKEALSLKRWREASEADTALFETPEQAQRVKIWRDEQELMF